MKCKIPKSKNQIEQKYKNYKPTKVYKKGVQKNSSCSNSRHFS